MSKNKKIVVAVVMFAAISLVGVILFPGAKEKAPIKDKTSPTAAREDENIRLWNEIIGKSYGDSENLYEFRSASYMAYTYASTVSDSGYKTDEGYYEIKEGHIIMVFGKSEVKYKIKLEEEILYIDEKAFPYQEIAESWS